MSHPPFKSLCFCTRAATLAAGRVAFLKSPRVYSYCHPSGRVAIIGQHRRRFFSRGRGLLLRQNFGARGLPSMNGAALAGDSPFSISLTVVLFVCAINCSSVHPILPIACLVLTLTLDVIHGSFPPSCRLCHTKYSRSSFVYAPTRLCLSSMGSSRTAL